MFPVAVARTSSDDSAIMLCTYGFWATVCKTVRPMLSDRCLSVTFVHCGQTVGRIKMKLGMQVGLGRGHIVLDGDPAPLPKREGTGSLVPGGHLNTPELLSPGGKLEKNP